MNFLKQLPAALLATAMAFAAASGGIAQEPAPTGGQDFWSDPEFQKQFLGSYGVLSELEPRLSAVEKQQLEKIIPLLSANTPAAKKALEKAATPQSSALFDFTLGNLAFQAGDMDEARQRFLTAVGKFPNFRRAHKNLALVEARSEHYEAAIREFSRVVELGGGDAITYGLLGHAYLATSQFMSGESAFRSAALLQPDSLDWRIGLIQCLLRQQKFPETVSLADELLKTMPERADLWLMQAGALAGMGEPRKAAENYEIVRRMGKASVGNLNALGDLYAHEAYWVLAEGAYREALAKDPGQPPQRPLRNLEVLLQGGVTEQAMDLLTAIRAAYGKSLPEDEEKKLLRLEARLSAARGKGEDASKALEAIVALDPMDGEALLLLGQHYSQSNDAERAIFCYERAESLEPFEAEARLRHARILATQGRYREAVPLLKRVQEIKPRDDVARYLEQVEKLSRSQ
jgi:tetratricopeptide (TPR) repeat protein